MAHYTEEQTMFRASYRKFIETRIAPHMDRWREEGAVDRAAFKWAGDEGMLMIWPDEKYGGLGDNDFRFEQVIIEENARAGTSDFFCTLHSRLVGPYIQKFGSEEQRRRWLPDCASGDKILAVAMTEPGAGSDLAAMKTRATDLGDHFLLNGSKTFISNGVNADLIITAARLDGAEGSHKLVLLVVERGMAGFSRGRNLRKMGLHAQDTAELFFDNVKIPKENVLGEPGKGFYYLMDGLAEERLLGATGYCANARRAFDITRDYCMTRQVFGGRLADQQNTQFQMAQMETEIDMMECYINHLVLEHNAGRLSAEQGAKAKLAASELEGRMADLGVQLHGGMGFMEESEICRMYRDARISRIYAGTSEIMKLIIGRGLFSQKYKSPQE